MSDTPITTAVVEEVLTQLARKADAEMFTHNYDAARKTRQVIRVIEHLREESLPPISGRRRRTPVRGCGAFYVVDFHSNTITRRQTQTAVALLCGVRRTTVSAAISGNRAICAGRYAISTTESSAKKLLSAGQPDVRTRRTLDKIVVTARRSGRHIASFTRMVDFMREYDLPRSTAYTLAQRCPGGIPQLVPGRDDRLVRCFFKLTTSS